MSPEELKQVKTEYSSKRQASWGDPIQGSIAKQEAGAGFEAGYRFAMEQSRLELNLAKIGQGHYKAERDIHFKETETFVNESTKKIAELSSRIKELENHSEEHKKEHFLYRTRAHLFLVRKWSDTIAAAFSLDARINKALLNKERDDHDQTKFSEPEYTAYVNITWKYYSKRHGIPFNATPELDEAMHVATYHHVKNNKHHPEYWDDATTLDNAISRDNRDTVPVRPIDGTKMPLTYIAAMCADWCAMSEELGKNTPQDWANKNVNVRWLFNPEQVMLIYQILDTVWPEVK